MAELRTLGQRRISSIFLFVTGLCTLPADHRVALRGQKRGGIGRKIEAGSLATDDDATRIAVAGQFVAESEVVVADAEGYVHRLAVGVLERNGQLVGVVVYGRFFDAVQGVSLLNRPFFLFDIRHALAEIADVGDEAEGRRLQDGFALVRYRVERRTVFHGDVYPQLLVRTGHRSLLRPEGRSTQGEEE